jgi:hypothetical protein
MKVYVVMSIHDSKELGYMEFIAGIWSTMVMAKLCKENLLTQAKEFLNESNKEPSKSNYKAWREWKNDEERFTSFTSARIDAHNMI